MQGSHPTGTDVSALDHILGDEKTIGAGMIEGWSLTESIYFAFVSGLTIGHGDLAPKSLLARALAIFIGARGVLVTALVAAIAVKALTAAGEGGE